jgi:hypothetical protein
MFKRKRNGSNVRSNSDPSNKRSRSGPKRLQGPSSDPFVRKDKSLVIYETSKDTKCDKGKFTHISTRQMKADNEDSLKIILKSFKSQKNAPVSFPDNKRDLRSTTNMEKAKVGWEEYQRLTKSRKRQTHRDQHVIYSRLSISRKTSKN